MNKFRQWLYRFMAGRYGTDKLNIVLLILALALGLVPSVLMIFGVFVPLLNAALALLSYLLTGFAIFRCFSRNTYRRYEENRKHRYFDCPKCRQPVRVPKGAGKIAITCPKCKEKFIRKA